MPQPADQQETLREVVEAALQSEAASVQLPSMLLAIWQLTQIQAHVKEGTATLPVEKLHLTSVRSFWNAVEATAATAASGKLQSASVDDEGDSHVFSLPHSRVEGAVIILPRWVPMVTNWEYRDVTDVFGPPRTWGSSIVLDMLQTFLRVGRVAGTVPSLDEYRLLGDKMALHEMYQASHELDPSRRPAPVPTVGVKLPARLSEQLQLCHWDAFVPSDLIIEATMKTIFRGIQELQASIAAESSMRQLFETPEYEPNWQEYVLKREFSEGGIGLVTIVFPTTRLQDDDLAQPWLARSPSPFDEEGSVKGVRAIVVTAPQLLRVAAEHVLRFACGEGWLLQPKLREFDMREYRVYLLGGAAAEGTSEDARVVWTPATLLEEPGSGIAVGTLFLPAGTFWWQNATDSGSDTEGGDEGLGRSVDGDSQVFLGKTPRHQQLYGQLVAAAREAAKALTRSPQGSTLRIAQHVFVRMDMYVYVPDDGAATILVNEMDWFNSAAMMIDLWDHRQSNVSGDGDAVQKVNEDQQQSRSSAATLARVLLPEVLSAGAGGYVNPT